MSQPVSTSRRSFLRNAGAAALAAGLTARARRTASAHSESLGARDQTTSGPSPQWEQAYRSALAPSAMGFAFAVAQNGQPATAAGVNLARSASEPKNPGQPWTPDTLFNIASVSKTITAVALMTLVQQQGSQLLDTPFWAILTGSSRFSGMPGAGVDSVTVRQLLTMHSGLPEDGTLSRISPSSKCSTKFFPAQRRAPTCRW